MTDQRRVQLFSLAAILLRRETDGSVTTKLSHGYRFALDGPLAVARRYQDQLRAKEPTFALYSDVSVLEIAREDFEATGFLKVESA